MNEKAKAIRKALFISDGALIVIVVILFAFFVFNTRSRVRDYQNQLDLGRKYYMELQYDKAILAFEKAINIEPRNIAAYEELAQIYIDQNDYESAIIVMNYAAEQVKEEERSAVYRYLEQYKKLKEGNFTQNSDDEESETTEPEIENIDVGSIMTFGSYEQDNDFSNGNEPIQWRDLEKQDDRVLVISDQILDCKPFNTREVIGYWENSTLREWLNNEFLGTAFTKTEQSSILTTTVVTDTEGEDITSFVGEPLDYHTETEDKVFLLSKTELDTYFGSDEAKQCSPTAYAESVGAGDRQWWTRSLHWEQRETAVVMSDGSINSGDGIAMGTNVDSLEGVRPAMWISLSN